MSEYDAIKTMGMIPAKQRYILDFAGCYGQFEGNNATEWFWSCMDGIKTVIEDWHITKQPKFIRIFVRRELDDRGAFPWIMVHEFTIQPMMPWIDLDEFEQDRERLFMIGQALALAWRNRDAAAITEHFELEKKDE